MSEYHSNYGKCGLKCDLKCRRPKTFYYKACLDAKQEVMKSISKATGEFLAKAKNDCEIKFKLSAWNIKGVTQAHIHLGNCGQDGPIVATLFCVPQPTGSIDCVLAKGKIIGGSLEGPLKGKPLRKLICLMNEGMTYVNIHTVVYPPGEIRGQIKLNGSCKPKEFKPKCPEYECREFEKERYPSCESREERHLSCESRESREERFSDCESREERFLDCESREEKFSDCESREERCSHKEKHKKRSKHRRHHKKRY